MSLGVLLFKEYNHMYGVNKGGYEQGYEVCFVCVLIYFGVIDLGWACQWKEILMPL